MQNKACPPLSFTPWVANALLKREDTIIVTGAGGWLGQATMEMLEQCLGDAFARRVLAFGSSSRILRLRSGRTLPCNALGTISTLTPGPYLVLHYAFLTRDKVSAMSLAEFTEQNEAISDMVEEAATRLGASGIFVPSSGAVYRQDRSIDEDVERNPYGVLKARDEQRFLRLRDAMRVVSIRVFNLSGPFINKLPSYALSSILTDVLQGRPIQLQSNQPVWRSYIHVRDVIDVAMGLLLSSSPLPAEAFDTAGDGEIEIGELAACCAKLLGKPDWPVQRPAVGSEPNRYVGDGAFIRATMKELALSPRDLNTQILDTAQYCREVLSLQE
jgi:nucleoside-diphosphate-sugar epimerase